MRKARPVREKLLAIASEVFVQKGFRGATIAEICKRAKANIAAVNYYFGTKEALYQETWRHCLAESMRKHPPDGGVSPDAPAEERLRGQMRALMERLADPETKDFFISQMEIINPTGLLEEVMHKELDPLKEKTLAVVRELLGPDAGEQDVYFCGSCIASVCIHPMLMLRMRQSSGCRGNSVSLADTADFIEHAVRFALAGARAIGDGSGDGRP